MIWPVYGLAWIGNWLKDGPAQCVDNASCYQVKTMEQTKDHVFLIYFLSPLPLNFRYRYVCSHQEPKEQSSKV